MEKEQLYEHIEAYLEGELEGEVLTAFERELATDEVLVREVALHRRLQEELGDGPKMQLRAMLEAVAAEFPPPDPNVDTGANPGAPNGGGGGVPFWWFGLAFFLLVGAGIWWYWSSASNKRPALDLTEQTEEPTSAPTTDSDATPDATEENTAVETEERAAETAPQQQPARPQAYDANARLESLIGQEAAGYTFADAGLQYEVQGQRAYLNFNGKVTTAQSVEDGLFLNLYTNQYPGGRALREQLQLSALDPDAPIAFAGRKEYIAVFAGETRLQPALYYGVITLPDSDTPLWVGKVRVE